MSNETSILLRSEEVRMPAATGFAAAAKYLNSHSSADPRTSEMLIRHHPEQSIILALTYGFALGWMVSEALFPEAAHK